MSKIKTYKGVIDHGGKEAYILCDKIYKTVKIKKSNFNFMHEDEVEFEILSRKRQGHLLAKIISLVKRNKTQFVGIIQKTKNFAFVIIEDKKIKTDFFIPGDNIGEANDGDKVLVKLLEWKKQDLSPIGKIVKVFGEPGDHHTELNSIIAKNEIAIEFSQEVKEYTEQISEKIENKEIKQRRDFREITTFTIDPIDAKDFDDALSFEKIDENNFEIGIHIADVSHYVKPSTILDKEAYNRATSIYLVDRVIPMLPEKLSNKVCSLRPDEDKLTFSAVFNFNKKGEINNSWFGRTIIRSNKRFSYQEAQEIIETKKNIISKKNSLTGKEYKVDQSIVEAIITLDDIAKRTRNKREKNGSINFNRTEVGFILDKEKNPKEIYFKQSADSNKLIEEFMLIANKKVAEVFNEIKNQKHIYRVHDLPDNEKLKSLKYIVKGFGYNLDLTSSKGISKSLNILLNQIKGKEEQNLIESLALRSMSKAEYSTTNIGHYGLAFTNYTHFTSPIRRYPDVLVHRLLDQIQKKHFGKLDKNLQKKAMHCSEKEMVAAKAERDSIKFMQIKFMENKIGESFSGIISGVSDWGIYVEIEENKCEGMVYIKDIEGDKYYYSEQQQAIFGRKTNKKYTLGDKINIEVKKADLVKKHLDFIII
jgi:ribonuclease R/exosome complex exonuclease DIS3/RRP44